jgi:hypothetical protein
MDPELKRATDEVAEFAAAAKALLGLYETKLAKVVNDLELAKNRSSDHEGQIRKSLDDISRTGKELARQQRDLVTEIEKAWTLRIDRTAATAGAEQARVFGEGIALGLQQRLDGLASEVEEATRRFRWMSAAKWGVGIALGIPLTVAIGVWALVPKVEGVEAFEVYYAMQRLEPCKVGNEGHVCVAIDPKQKLAGPGKEAMAVVKGL